jgi:hypothetical protein
MRILLIRALFGFPIRFSSQGSIVDRVIVNDDSMRSARLVSREQLYLSGSPRARTFGFRLTMPRLSAARDSKKEIALDAN